MKVRRGLVHMQHHVEHPEMGVALLKGFCELRQRLGCPPATLRAAAAVAEISDLEDGLMEQLLLLTLPDMLVIVRDLISGLFLPGVVDLQRRVKQLVIDLLQILVDKDDVLPRPVAVYIGRCKLPVVMPDTTKIYPKKKFFLSSPMITSALHLLMYELMMKETPSFPILTLFL